MKFTHQFLIAFPLLCLSLFCGKFLISQKEIQSRVSEIRLTQFDAWRSEWLAESKSERQGLQIQVDDLQRQVTESKNALSEIKIQHEAYEKRLKKIVENEREEARRVQIEEVMSSNPGLTELPADGKVEFEDGAVQELDMRGRYVSLKFSNRTGAHFKPNVTVWIYSDWGVLIGKKNFKWIFTSIDIGEVQVESMGLEEVGGTPRYYKIENIED